MLLRLFKNLLGRRRQSSRAGDAEELRQALATGDIGRARVLSDVLLAARPDDIDAVHRAGMIAHLQGDTARAIALLTRAACSANDPAPSLGLGYVLREAGQVEAATEYFRRAVAIDPELYDARLALARVLYQGADLIGAEEHVRHALALRPDAIEAKQLLLIVLYAQARHEETARTARHLQRVKPSDGRSVFMALLMPAIYESRAHIEHTRANLKAEIDALLDGPPLAVADPVTEIAITPFYLAYHGLNNRELQQRIAHLCRSAYRPALTKPRERLRPRARIKVGFVSEHFNNHSVARANHGFISRLRRSTFEVTVFSLSRIDDAFTRKIRSECDRYVALGGQPLARIEQMIADHGMDILFFTDVGMDPLTYFLAYSRLAMRGLGPSGYDRHRHARHLRVG